MLEPLDSDSTCDSNDDSYLWGNSSTTHSNDELSSSHSEDKLSDDTEYPRKKTCGVERKQKLKTSCIGESSRIKVPTNICRDKKSDVSRYNSIQHLVQCNVTLSCIVHIDLSIVQTLRFNTEEELH